ncbi:sulfite exporter TauE/SafE family protein [Chryseobacterium sp.]|uniref:sulfite exporter TauE/SafE family protein n=1 Tax=Chryseobacterium sp. TaxID=1871047 RepID=UPI0011CAA382|nr:sulfite exporter TauE/SafE family protein [Chryseobacterium sp.]TXF74920.1 sulfite exporter TauE/SafE family protein [Chryseobacterium sp.]
MDTLGYIASVFIGISLGLIGGGGSILTVPVLVYLFGIDATLATAYSLFIVGMTSAVGSVSYFKKGLVHLKTALIFGIPSIVSVFLTRAYIVTAIPEEIFTLGSFTLTKNILIMLVFAALMILASYSMIRKCRGEDCVPSENKKVNNTAVIIQGTVVGFVTGLIGAGGGFLIIPALVNLLRLDIKKAIGTSLFIIALNSLFGFGVSATHMEIEWGFILKIMLLAIVGVFIGSWLSTKIVGKKLKPAFGWFVLMMGVYILIKEIIFQ